MTELYDALEACLQALERGASIENAVKRYPKLAAQLRPLLATSLRAREAGQVPIPVEVRRKGRAALMDRVREGQDARTQRRMIPFFPRLALTALLLGGLVMTSTGLVGASSSSLPGQQLYPVKRTWESVRLLFASSPQQRDLMQSGYEQERLDEISELLGKRISAPITFSGLLARQSDGRWTISGIPVQVSGATVLPSTPVADGAPVTVTGMTRPDGVVEAQQIQVLQPGVSLPPLEPSEYNEGSDSEPNEGAAQPAVATATPGQAPGGTPPAAAGTASKPATYRFSGVVQSMQGNIWTINGQPVSVDAAQIDGQVTVGSIVRFQGYYAPDGRFMVTTIELQTGTTGGKQGDSGDGGSSDGGDGN